jgi:hypothetical protein
MGMAGPVGKFINLGHKPEAWAAFCAALAVCHATPEQRWAAYVLVAIHDVGKSDAFRAQARGWPACARGAARPGAGREVGDSCALRAR